jgi:hypothetical protein
MCVLDSKRGLESCKRAIVGPFDYRIIHEEAFHAHAM